MRLKLISPGQLPYYTLDINRYPIWYYRLSLPILAALTPPEWEVEIVEGKDADSLDYSEDVDLVGLSVLTPFALKAYKIADAYRENGVPVIIGGYHPTAVPQEAKEHADAVAIGESDMIWTQILQDFKQGTLGDFYRQKELSRMEKVPIPRRDLLDMDNYARVHHIMPVRGCNGDCGFCVVPWIRGRGFRARPVAEVVKEIGTLQDVHERPFIIPENFMRNRAYARELFRALEPLNVRWSAEGYLPLSQFRDVDFLKAAKRAGCYSIYVETEMVSEQKNPRKLKAYEGSLAAISNEGIDTILNFTIGYDDDTPDVFEETIRFVEKTRPTSYIGQILTPWPGTALFQKMESEGRILHRNWKYYDNSRVVFKPKLMNMNQLHNGFYRVMQAFELMRG